MESLTYEQESQRWAVSVKYADGARETRAANIVISAVGIFNPIKLPNIKGLDRFARPGFHTAEWPADLDLTGKRVAMIGNGASAMQVGPEIQQPHKYSVAGTPADAVEVGLSSLPASRPIW